MYDCLVNRPCLRRVGLALILFAVSSSLHAQRYVEREIVIPWVEADPGLDALLVYVDLPGKHPLALITHGSARKTEDHALVSPWQFLPQALWFARRGWVALVVVRRGYGRSGGDSDSNHAGHCPQTDYEGAAHFSAIDLRFAIDYARTLPMVDATQIVAAGVSTGGLATVALTVNPPPGLVAAINFAGGRGSKADHDVCNPDDLIGAYRQLGKKSRIPMLWIYSENDKFFWPDLAKKFDAAFRAGGGQDQFILAPPIGDDGHSLFRHVEAWSAMVDDFLKAQNLTPVAQLLPEVKPPEVAVPAGLGESGQHAFQNYLILGPHKAFAMSQHSFGFSSGRITLDEARENAVKECEQAGHHEKCSIVNFDNHPVLR